MRPFIDVQTCNVHSTKILEKGIQSIILPLSAATLNPRRRRSLYMNGAMPGVVAACLSAPFTRTRTRGPPARKRIYWRQGTRHSSKPATAPIPTHAEIYELEVFVWCLRMDWMSVALPPSLRGGERGSPPLIKSFQPIIRPTLPSFVGSVAS